MRPKVKICGMRSPDDISAALGADALGAVVEVPRSPRNLVLTQAAELFARIPGRILKVAVTTVKDRELIRRIVGIGPDVLQLHLELPPRGWEEVRVWVGRKAMVWGLLGIREGEPEAALLERARMLRGAPLDGVVLDTVVREGAGGTGRTHDWRLSRTAREVLHPLPVILAGGLTPENVGEAIRTVEPDWVDVSSGVEEGGRKCLRKVRAFLEAVRGAIE